MKVWDWVFGYMILVWRLICSWGWIWLLAGILNLGFFFRLWRRTGRQREVRLNYSNIYERPAEAFIQVKVKAHTAAPLDPVLFLGEFAC